MRFLRCSVQSSCSNAASSSFFAGPEFNPSVCRYASSLGSKFWVFPTHTRITEPCGTSAVLAQLRSASR